MLTESKWWSGHNTSTCLDPLWSTARDDSTHGWNTEGLVGTLPASHHSIRQEACGAKKNWKIKIFLKGYVDIRICSMFLHFCQVLCHSPYSPSYLISGASIAGCLQEPPLCLPYLHQATTSRVRAMTTHTATPYKTTNSKNSSNDQCWQGDPLMLSSSWTLLEHYQDCPAPTLASQERAWKGKNDVKLAIWW